jgi:hypothetical protein
VVDAPARSSVTNVARLPSKTHILVSSRLCRAMDTTLLTVLADVVASILDLKKKAAKRES